MALSSACGIARWVATAIARSPVLGPLLILPVLGPLLLRQGLGWGAGIDSTLPWLFPAGWIGAAAGLVLLSRASELLGRMPPGPRWLGELAGLGAASLTLQLPWLGGALLAGAPPLDLGRAVPDILTVDLHLAGLGLLVLTPRISTSLRTLGFVTAAWLLPAIASPGPAGLRAPVELLDAGRALRADGAAAALAAALALVLASYLLRTRPRPMDAR